MSKLSAQCDELRSMSESVGLAMPQAATLMMGASDTIDRLDAENAKLRDFASESFSMAFNFYHGAGTAEDLRELKVEYHELGIECGDDCE